MVISVYNTIKNVQLIITFYIHFIPQIKEYVWIIDKIPETLDNHRFLSNNKILDIRTESSLLTKLKMWSFHIHFT